MFQSFVAVEAHWEMYWHGILTFLIKVDTFFTFFKDVVVGLLLLLCADLGEHLLLLLLFCLSPKKIPNGQFLSV
jgi:hypothetical protein